MRKLRLRKLKIAEQIIIVLLVAVLAPMTISAIIVNNVNQHAVRAQLKNTALLVANMVSDEMDFFNSSLKSEIAQLTTQLDFLPKEQQQNFLNQVIQKSGLFNEAFIVNTEDEFIRIHDKNLKSKIITIAEKTKDERFLILTFNVDKVKSNLFRSIEEDARQIYVISPSYDIIAAHNFSQDVFNKSIEELPENLKDDEAVVYGDIKNQPIVFL